MTVSGDPARTRLDRPVLVSNLFSGGLWLSPLALTIPLLFVIGAAYVAAGAVFLAALYAREGVTRSQEAVAWIALWLVAVALWGLIVVSIEPENTVGHYLLGLYGGLFIGTVCYLAWQIVALAIRHVIAWRSGRSFLPI